MNRTLANIPNLTRLFGSILPLWFIYATTTSAAEFRGEIKNSGGPSHRKTSLKMTAGSQTIHFCRGGQRFAMAQLAKSTVTVMGNLKSVPGEKEQCLFADSYKIHDIAPGRPAIVGELKSLDNRKYAVASDEGRTWKLSALAPGVKSLVGTTVVCDLVADSAATGETTWLVARMFAKP